MDPLRVDENVVVTLDALQCWSKADACKLPIIEFPSGRVSSFPVREDINALIYLWEGDITCLAVDAIVNPTNESLQDRNPVSDRIHEVAGPGLRRELDRIEACRTGEAKITKGCELHARNVIHTVGPRYNPKYRTAAENALYNSYRNVMQIAQEEEVRTLALSVAHTAKRGYPPHGGAHIALRTVRRFLEKNCEKFDAVIFVLDGDVVGEYRSLIWQYFPRDKAEEECAAEKLPIDVGNEDGEPVIEERKIRIAETPAINSADSTAVEKTLKLVSAEAIANDLQKFASMDGDHDEKRRDELAHIPRDIMVKLQNQQRYSRIVRGARAKDFTSLAAQRPLYQSGVDLLGRPTMVIVGKLLPTADADSSRMMEYFIHTFDPIVSKPYTVIYFDTDGARGWGSAPWKFFVSLVDERYVNNLQEIYVVHPSFASKMEMWWFLTWTLPAIKERVAVVSSLRDLFRELHRDDIDVPPFVVDYDRRVNGNTAYAHLESSPAPGAGSTEL